MNDLSFLRLLQLADSALPIGATAHSFGLETLVEERTVQVDQLAAFLTDYLGEAGRLEATFCRRAHRLVNADTPREMQSTQRVTSWLALNERLSAFKLTRESRMASATLGRRLLQLLYHLEPYPLLHSLLQCTKETSGDAHYSTAFGLAGGLLDIEETTTVLAYLHQSLLSLVSACQRLLPLGQNQASAICWQLKPELLSIASSSLELAADDDDPTQFTQLLDLGSMRHPDLPTRLFIS